MHPQGCRSLFVSEAKLGIKARREAEGSPGYCTGEVASAMPSAEGVATSYALVCDLGGEQTRNVRMPPRLP